MALEIFFGRAALVVMVDGFVVPWDSLTHLDAFIVGVLYCLFF
jgi:hypothetical protein